MSLTENNKNNIATLCNDLNSLSLYELWVCHPRLEKYLMTPRDISEFKSGDPYEVWCIQPQTYDGLSIFDTELLEYFYEYEGYAVTGSGCDLWLLYKPGMVEDIQLVYEELSNI